MTRVTSHRSATPAHITGHRTSFSMILEINGRLEIGRKFFSSLGSRLGFLRRGKMTALLKTWGNKARTERRIDQCGE